MAPLECQRPLERERGQAAVREHPRRQGGAFVGGVRMGAHRLAISSTKSMIGHTMGAAGAIETAVSIKQGLITPMINYEQPDLERDLDYVPNQARPADVRVAVSESMGFGGHNAVLVLERYAG